MIFYHVKQFEVASRPVIITDIFASVADQSPLERLAVGLHVDPSGCHGSGLATVVVAAVAVSVAMATFRCHLQVFIASLTSINCFYCEPRSESIVISSGNLLN